jgi:AI-2 transport protein TqsA
MDLKKSFFDFWTSASAYSLGGVMETCNPKSYACTLKGLIICAAFVIIVAGMKAAKAILVPFLLSIFISIICSPLLFWLRKKKLPMWVALAIVLAIVLLAGSLMGLMVGASLNSFTQTIPVYQAKLQEKVLEISAVLHNAGINLSEKELVGYLDPGYAMNLASKILSGLGTVLSNAFLIFITVIFILLEAATFHSKLSEIFGPSRNRMAFFDKVIANINHYMVIKTWISLGVGLFVAIWCLILGIDYAIIWGILAFALNYVPAIGAIIAGVPVVLLAFVQNSVLIALLAAAGFTGIHIVVGNILEPRIMGKGLGISTLIVFLSLVFWGWVLGPIGMLLSIPLTMAIKIGLSSSEETRWIGTLMDSENIKELFEDDPQDLAGPV